MRFIEVMIDILTLISTIISLCAFIFFEISKRSGK